MQVKTTSFDQETKAEPKKRRNRAKPKPPPQTKRDEKPKDEAKKIGRPPKEHTRKANSKRIQQIMEKEAEKVEPKPKGRPPKEADVDEAIMLYKEAVAKIMLLKRLGKLSGVIVNRCSRDTGRIINVLEKRR